MAYGGVDPYDFDIDRNSADNVVRLGPEIGGSWEAS